MQEEKKKSSAIWKIGAVGCLGFIVLVGIAVAILGYGMYKAGSSVQQVAVRTGRAIAFTKELTKKLSSGDTSSVLAPGVSLPDMTPEQVALTQGRALRFYRFDIPTDSIDPGLKVLTDLANLRTWRFEFQYAKSGKLQEGGKILRLHTVVECVQEACETFHVTSAEYKATTITLAEEAPTRAVVMFHKKLTASGASSAYLLTAPEFQKETPLEAFETFVKEQGAAFKLGEVSVQEVEYMDDDHARVVAKLTGPKGIHAMYEFEASRGGQFAWLVSGMRALVTTAPK